MISYSRKYWKTKISSICLLPLDLSIILEGLIVLLYFTHLDIKFIPTIEQFLYLFAIASFIEDNLKFILA